MQDVTKATVEDDPESPALEPIPPDKTPVDTESLEAYVESLSPDECHSLYDLLKAKYDGGEENKKFTMADIAEGK